jgi:hypothetical protein
MPSGTQIFPFFALRIITEPKIPGAIIPRGVFTQPGSIAPFSRAKCMSATAPKAAVIADIALVGEVPFSTEMRCSKWHIPATPAALSEATLSIDTSR